MDIPREHVLADAALAGDEQLGVPRGRPRGGLAQRLDRGAPADDFDVCVRMSSRVVLHGHLRAITCRARPIRPEPIGTAETAPGIGAFVRNSGTACSRSPAY